MQRPPTERRVECAVKKIDILSKVPHSPSTLSSFRAFSICGSKNIEGGNVYKINQAQRSIYLKPVARGIEGAQIMKMTSLALAFLIAGQLFIWFDSARASQPRNHKLAATTPACRREILSLTEGETDAAMGGVRVTPYIFTNISSSTCALGGYPKLELLNRKGLIVRRARKQPSDTPAETVMIESGKTAWFDLYYNSGGAGHVGRPCPTYPRLRILAPGTTRPFAVRSEITSCARSDFEVSSIHAGMPD